MNNSNRLLDLYSQKLSLETNTAIALKLGVKQPTVSMWRSGKSHPNASAIDVMCKAINQPLREWLPLIEAERTRSEADKKVWLRLAQTAAAFAMIYVFSRLDGHTGSINAAYLAFANVYYVKLDFYA